LRTNDEAKAYLISGCEMGDNSIAKKDTKERDEKEKKKAED